MRNKESIAIKAEMLFLVIIYSFVLLEAYLEWIFQGLIGYGIGLITSIILLCIILRHLHKYVQVDLLPISRFDCVVMVFLLLLYVSKVAFPDIAWDTRNYHIYAQESLLRNPVAYDLLPTRPINANTFILSDLIFRPFRELLGYRLGTLPTLLVMIITYFIVKRILINIGVKWPESILTVAACVITCVDYMLMLTALYYTDTLAIPLILEALYIILEKKGPLKAEGMWLGYLAGLAVSIKVSNAFLVIVLAVVWLIQRYKELNWSVILGAGLLAIIPVAIFIIRGVVYTQNPLFPYGNTIFKTDYFVTDRSVNEVAALGLRFGPETMTQYLFWPFYIFADPGRAGEEQFTTGRLAISFLAMLVSAVVGTIKKNRKMIMLSGIWLGFYGIYLLPFEGYLRYMPALDVLGGIMTVYLAHETLTSSKSSVIQVVAFSLACLMVIQTSHMILGFLIYNRDVGQRKTVITDYSAWKNGMKAIGKDRVQCYTDHNLEQIDGWIVTNYCSGFPILIDNSKPIYGLGESFLMTEEMIALSEEILEHYTQTGQSLWCAANPWETDVVIHTLAQNGLRVSKVLPFESAISVELDLMIMECEWEKGEAVTTQAQILPTTAELDISGREQLTLSVCMNGHNPQRENLKHTYNVDLLKPDGSIITVESFVLSYFDESIQIEINDLDPAEAYKINVYPVHELVPGSLLIIVN